ncbi:MAG: TolC family protein [Spirochaetes bacterium]|nr:TolC family protein [Spirochaetota bacterium]
MNKPIIIIFLIVINLYGFTQSTVKKNEKIEIDIDTAVKRALKHNLTLKNSTLDLDYNRIALYSSWNRFVPNTSFSGSMGFNRNFDDTDNDHNSLSAGFTTSLSLSAKMIFDVKQTVLDYHNGMINQLAAERNLNSSVKKLYYNLKIMQEELNIENSKLENAKTRYDANQIKFKTGLISEIDRLKSEYDYKSIHFDQKKMADNISLTFLDLKFILGIEEDSDVVLTSSMPETETIDYEKIKQIPIEKNLDLQILNLQIKSLRNNRNMYISNLSPTFSVSYNLSSALNKDFIKDNWNFNNIDDWNNTSTFRFQLSIPVDPLFPFSTVQNNIIKQEYNIAKELNILSDKKESIKKSIAQIIYNLKGIEDDINTLNLNIKIAETSYELTEKLYNANSKSYLELKDAENALFDAKVRLLRSKYQYLINFIDLNDLLNIDINEVMKSEK